MSDIKEIINQGLKFYNKLREDENGRYRSWEYCYKIFHDAHISDKVDSEFLDYLCLHLSFYLASWGMYRGSSFLLQRDYKVHKTVIEELLKDEYNSLWGIGVNEYKKIENQQNLQKLVTRIKEIYNEIRLSVKETIPKNDLSNTLVTKVLMGTLGCVPAYDRYFISGIRNEKAASGNFNIKSIIELVDFYNKYYNEFENARSQMSVSGMEYPQMKILDSCFWQIGFDLDENKGLKISH
jgi:hypothetical protein